MRQGDVVYFITKGVVRSGVLVNQNNGKAVIRYQKGNYQKLYHYKLCQVADEIEGGANGRPSNSSDTTSNIRLKTKNSKLFRGKQPNQKGQSGSKKVFVGAWRIRNMA